MTFLAGLELGLVAGGLLGSTIAFLARRRPSPAKIEEPRATRAQLVEQYNTLRAQLTTRKRPKESVLQIERRLEDYPEILAKLRTARERRRGRYGAP